ncbi:MAG: hypothetical protein HY471_02090 [Candidatus Sungbacteria bacterium]|nr:hypothetical protein [Candidatus Sungbacteria bacterium]
MEKIKTIRTAVSPEEEMPIQVKVADTDCYQQLENGSIEITQRKAIVFAIGR